MIELTADQCAALEKAVAEKLCAGVSGESGTDLLFKQLSSLSVRATIATIREYERMQDPSQSQ